MNIAIVGYGAVASIHARKLASQSGLALAIICGPSNQMARAFAADHGIARFTTDLNEALRNAEAVIIASPSTFHFDQAHQAIEAGVHVLVELPPCGDSIEARKLTEEAQRRGVVLQCAHTSRYLEPYRRVRRFIQEGRLGDIQQVSYLRHMAPRRRSWVDDSLIHHAAHPLDLFLEWFGEFQPLACAAVPQVRQAQSVSVLAKLPTGSPLVVSISYASQLAQCQMVVVGQLETVATDGFTYIRSSNTHSDSAWEEEETYHRAIHDQDTAFLCACRGESKGVNWSETQRLIRMIDCFRRLAADK